MYKGILSLIRSYGAQAQSLATRSEKRLARSDSVSKFLLIPGISLITLLVASFAIIILYSFLQQAPPQGSLHLTVDNYGSIINSELFQTVVIESLSISAKVTLLCFALAYPTAYYISNYTDKRKNILLILFIIPMWTNIVVRTLAWMQILGEGGLINYVFHDLTGILGSPLAIMFTENAVVIGLAYIFLPLMLAPLYTSLENINDSHIEAAKNLGAGNLRAFSEITLPQTIRGIASGSAIVFTLTFGAFVTPQLLGGAKNIMVANLIGLYFNDIGDWAAGSAIAILFVLIGIACVYLLLNVVSDIIPNSSIRAPETVMQKIDGIEPPNSLGRRLLGTFTVLVYVFLYLPIGVVILLSFSPSEIATFPLEGLSFQWYANLIPPNHDSQLVSALVRSLILGSIAVVGAAIVGTLTALGIVRGSFRFLSGRALNIVFLLPVLIPWIVSGIAVLTLFTYLNVNGTFLSLIAGHILITLPFVVLIVGNRLRGLDRSIEEAAMNLGASRLKTFREVTFPLIFPAIAASVLIAFTFSFDNFIQTYFWATSEYQTLPLVIFSRIQHGFTPTINAISTLIVVLSVTISLLGEWLYGFTTSTGEETE